MNFIFTILSSKGVDPIAVVFGCLLVVAIGVIIIGIIGYRNKQANKRNKDFTATDEKKIDKNDNYESRKPEDVIRQVHIDREAARIEMQEEAIQQQAPAPQQAPVAQVQPKSGGGFLKFLGILFLIVLIIGSVVFVAKCAINEASNGEFNADGNPVLLNRAATLNDFTLTESVEATITNLKESYILVPNVDIKNLEITFRYYDSSKNLIATKIKNVGNVTKNSEYTVSIEHSLAEIFKISTVSYNVTGGTVSYFA